MLLDVLVDVCVLLYLTEVCYFFFFFFVGFFFQAEDGIRDVAVTGVQTCALPISTLLCILIATIGK